jgi:hypothetical protein
VPSLSPLCVFDQNTNKRCNSFHICICECNSASTQTFCTDISCLPFGQGRPFFYIVSADSALFAKKMAENCPINGQKSFLATLGAVSRAEDLLATIVFSRRRAKGFLVAISWKRNKYFPRFWNLEKLIWEPRSETHTIETKSPSPLAAKGPLPHLLCYTIIITITQPKYVSSFILKILLFVPFPQ